MAPPLGYNNFLSNVFQLNQLTFASMLYSLNRKIIGTNVRARKGVHVLGKIRNRDHGVSLLQYRGI
jgi:hypothetical protein